MGQNREKHRINSHPIIHCPTSKGVSEMSERVSAAERASKASRTEQAQRVSGASERANGRASGPVLRSVFLAFLAHSASRENDGPQSLKSNRIFRAVPSFWPDTLYRDDMHGKHFLGHPILLCTIFYTLYLYLSAFIYFRKCSA